MLANFSASCQLLVNIVEGLLPSVANHSSATARKCSIAHPRDGSCDQIPETRLITRKPGLGMFDTVATRALADTVTSLLLDR